jgi:hypothetical protein
VHNVNGLADKMIWNAHCRVVNLLANDGKDGAPFLDVQQFDQKTFSDFCPDNPVPVVGRMNESWHRAEFKPAMVRMSTKQYPIGSHSSPLEEIDEIADKIFDNIALSKSLPTGRATKLRMQRRGKERAPSRAAFRDDPQASCRGNWLAFPAPSPPLDTVSIHNASNDVGMLGMSEEPRISAHLRNRQQVSDTPAVASGCSVEVFDQLENGSTRLDALLDRYGIAAFHSDQIDTPNGSEVEHVVAKAPSWRARLINDHKRRLTQRWGDPSQTLRTVLPGIKQIITEAIARGFRPTGNDYQRKIRIIAAREQQQTMQSTPLTGNEQQIEEGQAPSLPNPTGKKRLAKKSVVESQQDIDGVAAEPRKKRRKTKVSVKSSTLRPEALLKHKASLTVSKKMKGTRLNDRSGHSTPLPTHQSGSRTLEAHQILPPGAYFEAKVADEKLVWRCGLKHAMGYYYNAGDRKTCRGCNTNITENPNHQRMDFYMPPKKHFHQTAPDMKWRPSKLWGKARRAPNSSHNSIAKAAYWTAIDAGANMEEARGMGVNAVLEHLRPKPPKAQKEPTLEPTPEPEPDLGPHPSNSTTMEHGQDLPECVYFDKQERHEELAWRCDVNHALGRYYLAGDKKSCPGCGSSKSGQGKRTEMDFYMPKGVIVRQEAPGLSNWKPRRPYKTEKSKVTDSVSFQTHNQLCAKTYFEAVNDGKTHEEALTQAMIETDRYLDSKVEDAQKRRQRREEEEEDDDLSAENGESSHVTSDTRKDSATISHAGNEKIKQCLRNSRGGYTVSLVPKKRSLNDLHDSELDEVEEYKTPQSNEDVMDQEIIDLSSSEETSSGSDSE